MTYIFSQGTLASADEVNDNFNKLNKLTNEKAINDVSATNSGVLAGSSQVLIDKFLDANGQNNTVDTGTTTAEYRTGKIYMCDGTSTIAEPSFETVASWTYSETDTDYSGARSSTWASKGTYSYLLSSAGAITNNAYAQILQNVDVTSYNNIVFDYNVTFGSGGDNYLTAKLYFGATEMWSKTLNTTESGTVSIDCSSINGANDIIFKLINLTGTDINIPATNFYIDNLTTAYSDSTIQSVATTIPTGMTKVFVTPLMYEALATGDSITADVSIDNGAHYTTGVPLNTWSPITSANGTQLIVKMNLNTASGVSSPKILGWRVLME